MRKISFVVFWALVAGSACYVGFQMLVGMGLEWRVSTIVAGFVFITVMIFVNRHELR
jgi:hypothetical protein